MARLCLRRLHARAAPARRWASALTPREQADLEQSVADSVLSVRYPSVSATVRDLNLLQHVRVQGAKVQVTLQLPTVAAHGVGEFRAAVQYAANAVLRARGRDEPCELALAPWRHAHPRMASAGKCLEHVGSVIAVASGKGGVGKSSVAVNLAFALAAKGARVGLLDADIYGPSLPLMVRPRDAHVKQSKEGTINALLGPHGVKCMSYGWVARRNEKGERGGAFMRGPMVSQVVQQLAKFTEWGQLDHLVVDMPPGTGDVHISIGQLLPLSGVVHVTTPQALALIDVVKGVDMFAALKVRPLALVLNMAWFSPADAPEKRYTPFGEAPESLASLVSRAGLAPASTFRLPILPSLSESGDSGVPEVVRNPTGPAAGVFDALAGHVAEEVQRAAFADTLAATQAAGAGAVEEGGSADVPTSASSSARAAPGALSVSGGTGAARSTLTYSPGRGLVLRTITQGGAGEAVLSPATVRRACRCAACVDEMTGVQRLQPGAVKEDVAPLTMAAQGNYGVAITWSDGHSSGIYTFEQLERLTRGGGT